METGKPSSNIHELGAGRNDDPFEVPADQLERIIARAAVFQNVSGDGERRHLTEEEIISIGKEVGLAPNHVRRALTEWRADSLVPPEPEDDRLARQLVGSAHVRVRRVIAGDAAEVHRRFERHLRQAEHMRPVRMRAHESLWEPNDGLASVIKRGLSWALDADGRSYELSELKSLSIVTAPVSEYDTMVTLTADLSKDRSEVLGNWGWTLAILGGVGLIMLLTKGSWWSWMLVGAAGVGVIMAPFMMTSRFRATRRRTALLLEGLLDQLEQRP